MSGETGGTVRPINSLLEEDVSFDHATTSGKQIDYDSFSISLVIDNDFIVSLVEISVNLYMASFLRNFLQWSQLLLNKALKMLFKVLKLELLSLRFSIRKKHSEPNEISYFPQSPWYLETESGFLRSWFYRNRAFCHPYVFFGEHIYLIWSNVKWQIIGRWSHIWSQPIEKILW